MRDIELDDILDQKGNDNDDEEEKEEEGLVIITDVYVELSEDELEELEEGLKKLEEIMNNGTGWDDEGDVEDECDQGC